MQPEPPNQALQRTLRARHEFCLRSPRAVPSASLSLRSLGAYPMPTRRVIQGVLQNFLGTFISRYSDYGGYWLFGILADDLAGLCIDLLAAPIPSAVSDPMATTITLARAKFREQMQKVAFLLPPSARHICPLLAQHCQRAASSSVTARGTTSHLQRRLFRIVAPALRHARSCLSLLIARRWNSVARAAPNNALQRTEAGGRLFSELHVLRRQPPSLSLEALGPESLAWGSSRVSLFPFFHRRACSRSFFGQLFLRVRLSLRSPFPGGSARHSPAGVAVCPRSVRSVGAGLTTRSSEQRLAVEPVSWLSPSSPASVAELGSVSITLSLFQDVLKRV